MSPNNLYIITPKTSVKIHPHRHKTNKILSKVSISSANTEGALANLEKELSHWSFDKVKKDAKQNWKRELQKIRIEDDREDYLKIFSNGKKKGFP